MRVEKKKLVDSNNTKMYKIRSSDPKSTVGTSYSDTIDGSDVQSLETYLIS